MSIMMSSGVPDKIIVLYLIYGEQHMVKGRDILGVIVKKMFPGADVEFVVIDNALPGIHFENDGGLKIIGGDNSLMEFSGWDKGVLFINKHLRCTDNTLVLFANDTFHRRAYKDGSNFLDVYDAPILSGKDILNSAIGYVDDFPKNVTIFDIEYKSWIRSNIFFLPIRVVKKLYPFSITMDASRIFSKDINKFWSDADFISDNWKAYISSWLFGLENPEYPEYCLHWLKAHEVNSENYDFFKKKALCILAEHYLSARLIDMDVPIIDTNIFEKMSDRHVSAYYG